MDNPGWHFSHLSSPSCSLSLYQLSFFALINASSFSSLPLFIFSLLFLFFSSLSCHRFIGQGSEFSSIFSCIFFTWLLLLLLYRFSQQGIVFLLNMEDSPIRLPPWLAFAPRIPYLSLQIFPKELLFWKLVKVASTHGNVIHPSYHFSKWVVAHVLSFPSSRVTNFLAR